MTILRRVCVVNYPYLFRSMARLLRTLEKEKFFFLLPLLSGTIVAWWSHKRVRNSVGTKDAAFDEPKDPKSNSNGILSDVLNSLLFS